MQPTNFELVINLRAAESLGIQVHFRRLEFLCPHRRAAIMPVNTMMLRPNMPHSNLITRFGRSDTYPCRIPRAEVTYDVHPRCMRYNASPGRPPCSMKVCSSVFAHRLSAFELGGWVRAGAEVPAHASYGIPR
jgi:hypothetical protein